MNYRIGKDKLNWTIEERWIHGENSKTPGKEEWKAIAWFGDNLELAAQRLLQFTGRDNYTNPTTSITKLIEAVQDAQRSVVESIKELSIPA